MMDVTSIVAALAAFALVGISLSAAVRRSMVAPESAVDDPVLRGWVQAHANFVNYVPMALILLALAEYLGAGTGLLWVVAGLMIAGQVSHDVGAFKDNPALRGIGMLLIYASLLIVAAWLLTLLEQ